MEIMEVVQWMFSSAGLLGGIWVMLGKKYRGLIFTWFKTNEAQLSYEERYQRFQDAQMEKVLNTAEHYKRLNDELEAALEEKQEMLREHITTNKLLRVELKDSKRLIEKYKKINEEQEEQLNGAQSHLRRLRVYIKKLERILKEKNIDFEHINIE